MYILFHWQAREHKKSGDYKSARRFGFMALICNISVIVIYVIEVIIMVTVLAVYITTKLEELEAVRLRAIIGPQAAIVPPTVVPPAINCQNLPGLRCRSGSPPSIS